MNHASDFPPTVPRSTDVVLPISNEEVLRLGSKCVLAVIVGIVGPSYRPLGAMMRILPDGTRIGNLSSGCIEADIVCDALDSLQANAPRIVEYGQGAPFIDIKLPCGGGLEILLIPNPDEVEIGKALKRLGRRKTATLVFGKPCGDIRMLAEQSDSLSTIEFQVLLQPQPKFFVFGMGSEVIALSSYVNSLGYPQILSSLDDETLAAAGEPEVDCTLGLIWAEIERRMKLMGAKSTDELCSQYFRFRDDRRSIWAVANPTARENGKDFGI